MTSRKQALNATIGNMLAKPTTSRMISRRLFLYEGTQAFDGDRDQGFDVLNAVCEHFRLPFSSIRVAGSAQLGYSFFKGRDFIPQQSDVDIAIISAPLFQQYVEIVTSLTRGYTDLSKFQRIKGISTERQFRNYLSLGYFRPDLMPLCEERAKWYSFFRTLSNKHKHRFKSINAGLFLSEALFEIRNEKTVARSQEELK